ncbi:MAG: sensor histidine kinase [Thermomicrobiales bacterium]
MPDQEQSRRRLVRDLVALSALPAMWSGRAPPFIAGSLLDALRHMLRLDLAYIRLIDPAGGAAIEAWRPVAPTPPLGLTEALDASPTSGTPTTFSLPTPGGMLCAAACPIGYLGEVGVLLVGWGWPDYPTEEERVLLTVAANHTAIMVQRQRLEQRQRDFIAMVAHDLKNPLTTIKGYTQLLRRRGVYDERVVETIVAQADRLEGLIDDLRDAARIEADGIALHREQLDMTALVRRCVEEAQALTEAHTIHVTLPTGPVVGRWDAGRLMQVIANLLNNAVKYSPEGGEIRVEVTDDAGTVRVAVSDEGMGMSQEVAARVFERFYRAEGGIATDRKGLGLGLYISKALVEAHGGRITVASAPGAGSTFIVMLPHASRPPH